MDENQTKKYSHFLELLILALVIFTLIIGAFGAGVFVGQERARFSFEWAENYHRMFGGPNQGFLGNMPQMDFINGHGIFGEVIAIDGAQITIKGQDDVEKTVVLVPKATIRDNVGNITLADLKVGDMVVVIGAPNAAGQIEAQFIRVMPMMNTSLRISKYYFENI